MTDYIDPDRARFARFKDLPRDQPIQMLNLIKLRARATYRDAREASGRDAYRAYSRAIGPVFARLGGSILWSARPELMLIGPETEAWDLAFVAAYPSGQAFIDMLRDPDYRAAVVHRQAAVETSRLIRMQPAPAEEGLG